MKLSSDPWGADVPSRFASLQFQDKAEWAALGSLFCRTVEAGRQMIVETHSDYIMNRIRLDVRDRRTELTHEDVSILYFEREDPDVLIHPIRFDKDGNVLGTSGGYRRFFTDELNRSLDY